LGSWELFGPRTTILPISASQVAGITGMSHWYPADLADLPLLIPPWSLDPGYSVCQFSTLWIYFVLFPLPNLWKQVIKPGVISI
jgi:hypothetical protein